MCLENGALKLDGLHETWRIRLSISTTPASSPPIPPNRQCINSVIFRRLEWKPDSGGENCLPTSAPSTPLASRTIPLRSKLTSPCWDDLTHCSRQVRRFPSRTGSLGSL